MDKSISEDLSAKLNVVFAKANDGDQHDVIVIPVFEDDNDFGSQALNDGITDLREGAPNFKAKPGQVLSAPAKHLGFSKRVVLLGMGKASEMSRKTARKIGKTLYGATSGLGFEEAHLMARVPSDLDNSDNVYAEIANSAYAASYKFDRLKNDPPAKPDDPAKFETLTVLTDDVEPMEQVFAHYNAVAKGTVWARDLGNTPANMLYPVAYANHIKAVMDKVDGVSTHIITAAEMEQLGMEAALTVARGSENDACMVVMEYDGTGGDPNATHVGLVGKGVTMDTGGYSLKPGASMPEMKMDMAGSAAVVGAMRSLAEQGAKAKVTAIVGLVENDVSGKAYYPGDVIGSMAGKTIEVGNTDAEGRLVLADAMTHLQREYKPDVMMDMATLTGAAMMATGYNRSAIFTPHDGLAQEFSDAGERTEELVWRMPLDQVHTDAMKGKNADLSNMGNIRVSGASTAAAFLQEFVEGDTKWIHVDIAGPAIPASGIASGYGTALINDWVTENYSVSQPAQP